MADEDLPLAQPQDGWAQVRSRMRQLELSTGRLSSRWLAGNVVVVATAVLFLLTAIVLGTSVTRIFDNAAKTERAQIVLKDAGDLQDAMTRASSTARTYLLAHDSAVLRERNLAIKTVLNRLDKLATVMADDPAGNAILARVRDYLERRIALYDQLIAGTSPMSLNNSEAERLRLARINDGQITELREWANDRFRHFQHLAIADMRLAMVLALITGIAAPLFGFLGILLLRRGRENQQTRELHQELIHVQRLALMGETSAMLAHEINQPLAAAANFVAAARRLLGTDSADKTRAMLDRVEQQILRAVAIVRKLRLFIGKNETERSTESPELLVKDAITLLGTIDGSIDLKTEIAANLPPVFVDRVQVQQVLVNLMRNAIEAMQGSAQRALVLSMTHAGGKTIQVALADTGPGLSPEVTERLFQPFVSTKADGMGIGLSICQSIVSQHGGRIWAETNPPGGTVFCFTLPVVEESAAS